jgi:hypothetical protein
MPVQMNVMHHQLVGGYLCKLAGAEPCARPGAVADLLEGLAAFANDALAVEALQPEYLDATRTWRIAGLIEIVDVDRDAAAEFFQHTPQALAIRLPDPQLLAESRNLAVAFDAARRTGEFYLEPFYQDYVRGGERLSNSDFLDSRIADYVFASCR